MKYQKKTQEQEGVCFYDGSRSAFSLIELLSSVAILMIIVGMMSMVFTESDRSWNIGTSRADNNSAGRAALHMIAHDLQYAITDSNITFRIRPDRTPSVVSYGFANDEINFVSLQHDSSGGTNRTAREIIYAILEDTNRLGTFQLQRYIDGGNEIEADYSNHSYILNTWYDTYPSTSAFLIDNVAGLAFFLPDGSRNYDSAIAANSNRVPEYVDVYLEILNERDAERARGMPANSTVQKDFVDRSARRYTTRVYFHNRQGYRTP